MEHVAHCPTLAGMMMPTGHHVNANGADIEGRRQRREFVLEHRGEHVDELEVYPMGEASSLALLGIDDIAGIDASGGGHEQRQALEGNAAVGVAPELEGEVVASLIERLSHEIALQP
jgi:hypothetical protein